MSYPTSTGTVIQAIDYNSIRSIIEDVSGLGSNGYGVTCFITRPVTSTKVDINANSWKRLIQELNSINLHQTGANILYGGSTLTNSILQGQLIRPGLHNFLYDKAIALESSRYTVHPSQLAPRVTTNGFSERTTDWTGTIKHIVQVSWRTDLQARYFFNLGGYLNITAAHLNDASGGNNDAWKSIIAAVPTQTYTRTDFLGAGTKYYPVVNGTSPYENLQYSCLAIRNSNKSITFEITFYNTNATPPDINPPNPSIVVVPQRYTWHVQAEPVVTPPPTFPPTLEPTNPPEEPRKTYSILPSELDSCTVAEGQTKNFTIYTTNVSNGTVLYWTVTLTPSVSASDFSATSGSVTINSNIGTISIGINSNAVTETAPRPFYVELRSDSVNGPTLLSFRGACNIVNVSAPPPPPVPTYSIATYPISGVKSVLDGDSIQFQVTTTNVPNGTVLYWSTGGYNTDIDFSDTSAGSVTINSNTGIITRKIALNSPLEPDDWFQILLRLNSTDGTIVSSSEYIVIKDASYIVPNLPGNDEYFDEHLNFSWITISVESDGGFYILGLDNQPIYIGAWASPILENGGEQFWVKFILSETTGDVGSTTSASTGWMQLNRNRTVSASSVTQVGKGNVSRRSKYIVRIASDSAGTTVVAEGVYIINSKATASLFSIQDPLPSQGVFAEIDIGTVEVALSFKPNGTFDVIATTTRDNGTSITDSFGSPYVWGYPATSNIGDKFWIAASVSGTEQSGTGSSVFTNSTSWLSLASAQTVRVRSIPGTTAGSSRKTAVTYNVSIAADSAGSNVLASGSYTLSATGTVPRYFGVGGGDGGGSVYIHSYLPFYDKKAGEFIPGDRLLLLSEDRQGTMIGSVVSNRISTQRLLTLVSKTGITLTCSDNTPLTLEDGSSINSTEALGHKLPVQDLDGFRWEEIVEVRDSGYGEVATIYCLDQCYAAGDQQGRWIWTHNVGAEFEKK